MAFWCDRVPRIRLAVSQGGVLRRRVHEKAEDVVMDGNVLSHKLAIAIAAFFLSTTVCNASTSWSRLWQATSASFRTSSKILAGQRTEGPRSEAQVSTKCSRVCTSMRRGHGRGATRHGTPSETRA